MAVDPQQMALAQAIATHGSAGIQQANAAANTGAAGQQAALSGAADRAGLINAPTAFLQQAATQTAQPYANAAKSAANTSAAIGAYTNTLKGANDNYMSQLQAAMPLVQAGVDKASNAQNLSQMMQLYQLQRQEASDARTQELNAPKLQAAHDAATLASNQKSVMNKILANPNGNLRDTAIDAINGNTSETLAGALSQLDNDKAKASMKKLGVDENELRKTLTEYYTDPATFSSLQAAQASVPAAAPAAAPGPGLSTPFTRDAGALGSAVGPGLLDALKSLVPGAGVAGSAKNYLFGK